MADSVDVAWLTQWITACAILHKFLLDDESSQINDLVLDNIQPPDDYQETAARAGTSRPGKAFQAKIFKEVVEYLNHN